jgi:hypothetical protein
MQNIFPQIVVKIISEQEGIIGPIAVEQAKRINGLKLNWPKHEVSFKGEESKIVEELIESYRDFFGQVSVDVCKHAVKKLVSQLPFDQRPELLK